MGIGRMGFAVVYGGERNWVWRDLDSQWLWE